jgi:hypothetical protein
VKHILKLNDRDCRSVEGEPSALMFCGKPKQDGSSYCREHTKRYYTDAKARPRLPIKLPVDIIPYDAPPELDEVATPEVVEVMADT